MQPKKRLFPLFLTLVLLLGSLPADAYAITPKSGGQFANAAGTGAYDDAQSETFSDLSGTVPDADRILSSARASETIDLGKVSLTPVFIHPYPDAGLANDCFVWTGSAIRPSFTLSGNDIPIPDSDYMITEYNNNTEVSTENAKATITIEGINHATGTATLSFTILPVSMTETVNNEETQQPETRHIDAVSLQVLNPTYTSRSDIRPAISIDYQPSANKTFHLAEEKDYTIAYDNVTTTGGDYTITYTGHYKGTYTGHYDTAPIILDEEAKVECAYTARPYKGSSYTIDDFGISVTAKGLPLTKDVDYTLHASDDLKDAGSHIITIAAAAEDGSNKKFTGIYGVEVVIDPVDISPSNKDVTFRYTDPETDVYTGQKHLLPLVSGNSAGYENISLSYKAGGNEIPAVYGRDYKVLSYQNNTNAGTATAVIGAGSDNFTGTREVTFSIAPFDLSGSDAAAINTIAAQEYSGQPLTPSLSVIARLTADHDTKLIAGTDYTAGYSGNIAVGTDTAKVTITGTGNYKGSLEKTFSIKSNESSFQNASVTVAPLSFNGSVQTPVITAVTTLAGKNVNLIQGTDYKVSVKAADGVTPATLMNSGSYILELTGAGNYSGTIQTAVTMEKANLKNSNVRISFAGYDSFYNDTAYYIYDGAPQTPDVMISIDGKTIANTDPATGEAAEYRVSFKNNRLVGTATVIIKALGKNITGETTASFRIGRDIDAASIAFVNQPEEGKAYPSYPFTGGDIKPAIKACIGSTLLTEGKDYVVNYTNNRDASTDGSAAASVSISGIGAYAGTTHSAPGIKSFEITPLEKVDALSVTFHDADGTVVDANYIADFESGKPFKIDEVQINKVPIEPKNYVLSYTGNGAIGHATVTLDWQGTNIVQGQDEIVVEFDIRRLITNATVSPIAHQIYSGAPVIPEFTLTLKDGNTTLSLVKDVDYTVSCQNNINAGEATVTITGITENGIYAGSLTTEFDILPRTLTDAVIAPIPDQTFIGEDIEVKPSLSVLCGGRTLTEGIDYVTEFEDNDTAGTGIVTITPAGSNYEGEKKAAFQILPRAIDQALLLVSDCYYSGEELLPEAKVYLDGRDITDSITLEYQNNIETGTGTVTAYGTENYTGALSAAFLIKTQDLQVVRFKKIAAQTYTGKAIKPLPVLTNDGVELRVGTDYKVTYKSNKKPGTAAIIIRGDGKHYTGRLQLPFKITSSAVKSVKASVKAGGQLKITAAKKTAKAKISGYQISYRIKGKEKWSRITVESAKKLNTTLTNLTPGRVYQVRVRTFVTLNGSKTYGAYSKILTTGTIRK